MTIIINFQDLRVLLQFCGSTEGYILSQTSLRSYTNFQFFSNMKEIASSNAEYIAPMKYDEIYEVLKKPKADQIKPAKITLQ